MARKKNSAALYEVISSSRQKRRDEGLSVPSWMSGGHDDALTEIDLEEPGTPAQAAAEPPKPPKPTTGPLPLASAVRIRLGGLPQLVGLAAVLVLLGLLVLMFFIGRWTRGSGGTAPTAAEEAPAQVEGNGRGGTGRFPAAAAQPVVGKHHLVIQEFAPTSRDLGLAQDLERLCGEKGYKAKVYKFSGASGGYFVWSLQPFESKEGALNDAFVQAIEGIVREHSRTHGNYRVTTPWWKLCENAPRRQ